MTAVEWLVEKMLTVDWYTYKAAEFIEQAKDMEKDQILDAWKEGYDLAINGERIQKL